MIKVNNLKKIKSNFPVMIGKNSISAKNCETLINEIRNTKAFDDMIQGGRSRINKGSKNYQKNYLINSTVKLFIKKLKLSLRKLLRTMVGRTHICLSLFCLKNLQIKG